MMLINYIMMPLAFGIAPSPSYPLNDVNKQKVDAYSCPASLRQENLPIKTTGFG